MAKKKINISQSLIKDMVKYENEGYCGNLMEEKWIKGNLIDLDSDVINQGCYFEYLATGQLPKNGEVPEPETLKNGDLSAPYRRVYAQAENFKLMCIQMGIEILDTGEHKVKNGLDGVRDIKAKYKGEIITIDTKYSGLINDEWNPMGWKDLVNGNNRGKQLDYHKIQATHYTYVFGDPFYYWVFSSAAGAEDTGENLFVMMDISQEEIDLHLDRSSWTAERLNFYSKFGFEPRPAYNNCMKCPLFEKCEDAKRVQEPIIVKV